MFAREISIGGCLFVLYLVGLYITLNVPLGNILGKIFNRNDKIVMVVEIFLFFFIARILARWSEPGVTKFLEASTRSMVDILVDTFSR